MLFKVADCAVMGTVGDTESTTASLYKDSSEWSFEKRPGMLYVVVRAVSVGTNGNGDHFTEDELRKAYKTFVGKGVFVNHASNDIEKKRGRIVDAKWFEERGEKFVKCLLEVDAEAHPELARHIRSGIADSVSMGCHVAYSECSVCGNKARKTTEYCDHVKFHKGSAIGNIPVFEKNCQVEFIEVSFVSTGADPQAKVLEVIARQKGYDLQHLLMKAASQNDFDPDTYAPKANMDAIVLKAIMRVRNERKGQ